MKMNELIYKIAEIFKEDELVTIYISDKKIDIYSIVFGNIELRKIWRMIQQEHIHVGMTANANKKVRISLTMTEE